jgi:hypothetical protein
MKRFLLFLMLSLAVFSCGKNPSSYTSNPDGAASIGEIAVPDGFVRVSVADSSFAAFLRCLPLKPTGTKLKNYDGTDSDKEYVSYAVVDLPLSGELEQCADVVMRLRADYLFSVGRFREIVFHDNSGKEYRFSTRPSMRNLSKYLAMVFDLCGTKSLRNELPVRSLKDISPGDVLVFESKKEGKLGHAVIVADVARNQDTGKIAVLLVQGTTPAVDIHVVRNVRNKSLSPWIIVDPRKGVVASKAKFAPDDLRTWE